MKTLIRQSKHIKLFMERSENKGFYKIVIENNDNEYFQDLNQAVKRFSFLSRVDRHWL